MAVLSPRSEGRSDRRIKGSQAYSEMCTQIYSHTDDQARACAGIARVCTLLYNGHACASCVHYPLWRAHNLLGLLQALTMFHNQFPGRQQQPSPAQLNMSDNACCKKSPTCFCAICAILVIVLIAAFCIPLATQFMDSDPAIPTGASGPIDIHKSLIDRMSLLDISQEGSEGEGIASSTWILLFVFGFTIIFSCSGYAYHLKCRLPRRRIAREAERVQRERHELHSAFIEKMMEKENHGISPV